ncbi:alpha/beta fold hydrolase [Vibrio astriarenae]|uniref:alpha/beta fold hydrolase n=1 Tax=Vibrio astriarenae TaxID=1481923 RepID=UPI0037366BF3
MVPIVLLRGLLRESGHWRALIEELRAVDSQLVIVTPNVAGNGELYEQESPTRIESMLPQVMSQLPKGCERYHLIAISMGSMLASHWAKAYPEQVASLTLINPSFARFSPFWQRINLLALGSILSRRVRGKRAFQEQILNVTYPTHQGDNSLLNYHLELASSHPVSLQNALRQLVAAAKFKGFDTPPNCITQVIVSSDDQLVSSECGKAIANHWGVELKLFESDAHDLPLAQSRALATHLYGWCLDKR